MDVLNASTWRSTAQNVKQKFKNRESWNVGRTNSEKGGGPVRDDFPCTPLGMAEPGLFGPEIRRNSGLLSLGPEPTSHEDMLSNCGISSLPSETAKGLLLPRPAQSPTMSRTRAASASGMRERLGRQKVVKAFRELFKKESGRPSHPPTILESVDYSLTLVNHTREDASATWSHGRGQLHRPSHPPLNRLFAGVEQGDGYADDHTGSDALSTKEHKGSLDRKKFRRSSVATLGHPQKRLSIADLLGVFSKRKSGNTVSEEHDSSAPLAVQGSDDGPSDSPSSPLPEYLNAQDVRSSDQATEVQHGRFTVIRQRLVSQLQTKKRIFTYERSERHEDAERIHVLGKEEFRDETSSDRRDRSSGARAASPSSWNSSDQTLTTPYQQGSFPRRSPDMTRFSPQEGSYMCSSILPPPPRTSQEQHAKFVEALEAVQPHFLQSVSPVPTSEAKQLALDPSGRSTDEESIKSYKTAIASPCPSPSNPPIHDFATFMVSDSTLVDDPAAPKPNPAKSDTNSVLTIATQNSSPADSHQLTVSSTVTSKSGRTFTLQRLLPRDTSTISLDAVQGPKKPRGVPCETESAPAAHVYHIPLPPTRLSGESLAISRRSASSEAGLLYMDGLQMRATT
ncbi:hypothetical protein DFS34DRAFT_438153 [Phlyctochytrium arcticum]|nr:hypothetical protein DFS34DRAFT_438153 [Phlyctochytrium arcticum]